MNNVKNLVKTTLFALLASSMTSTHAANWLMLQGTEPDSAAGRVKTWGFIQAQYQKDTSDGVGGASVLNPPKLIGPNLDSQSQFNINRARLGARGTGFPLDGKVNYFLLAEFGNNGITYGNDGKILTDASITLNQIPGMRMRIGMFKYPGAEEGLQAIHVFDYINFTTVTNQLLLERFQSSTCDGGVPGTACTQVTDGNNTPTATPDADMNQYARSVGAFRDVGIQFFDTFTKGDWEHSYAVMLGNGNGLNYGDNDDNMDTYLYWSSEMVFGGKGGRREGLKLFAWSQDGTRTNGANRAAEQDRTRTGFGAKYLRRPFRASAELMQGEGMIFQGPHRPRHIFNNGEASGYYVEGGYYIPGTKWEVDLRIDSYTRDENHPTSAAGHESTFDTTTVGFQYHINKKSRINAEYSMRDFSSDTAATNNHLSGVEDRIAVQLTHIF